MQTGQTLLVLGEGGKIYHVVSALRTSWSYSDYSSDGRLWIRCNQWTRLHHSIQDIREFTRQKYQLGLQNEFVYVYKGDGTPARKAGGNAPIGPALIVADVVAGLTDFGDSSHRCSLRN